MPSSLRTNAPALRRASVLVVGLGGLGCPASLALLRAGVGRLVLCDDDVVDEGNLHRQILFEASDVGRSKTSAARDRLQALAEGSDTLVEARDCRLLPETAKQLLAGVDVVVEGADNFATKFLAADACHLANRAVVHGAAIRWHGTAWAIPAGSRPCYRCLFEDIPLGEHGNCETEGVMGPVVGVVGAMMAEQAVRILDKRLGSGQLWTYDGKTDTARSLSIRPRADCPLCGQHPRIVELAESRYLSSPCGAPETASGLEGEL